MFPITIELSVEELEMLSVMYENQIPHRDELAERLGCSPDDVRGRIDELRDTLADKSSLQFKDRTDVNLFAHVVNHERDSMKQASVTTTFTPDEQRKLRDGLRQVRDLWARVETELEPTDHTLPVELH